jgi:hypothetical protein
MLQAMAPLALAPLAGRVAAACAALCLAAALRPQQHTPAVHGQRTSWNSKLLELCPSLTAPYRLPRGASIAVQSG